MTGKIFYLNQDWNGGLTKTGKGFVLTRNGKEVRKSYEGKYFSRVFHLCKGRMLPYKGFGEVVEGTNYLRREKGGRNEVAREAETQGV